MTKLYPYQREGVEGIKSFGGRCLLADEMGLGKSLSSLTYSVEENLFPAVVVCPASLKWVWQHEAAIHYNLRAEVLSGRSPPKKGGFKTTPPLVIINYDVLSEWTDWLKRLKPKLLIVDECHYCASGKAIRTKATRTLSQAVPHMIAMSGTPMTNRPVELYPILNMLRPDLWKSFFPFGQRYCGPRRAPWGVTYQGASHLQELHDLLTKNVMIRRKKQDVLKELPEKQRCVVPVELSKPHQKEYREASETFLKWLARQKPQSLRSSMKAEALTRITTLKGLLANFKQEPVISWVRDFLAGGEEKLICFGVHKRMVRRLEKEFKELTVRVDGSVKGQVRQECFDRFQRDDRVRLLSGNIKAAGVGWTGTAARSVAFLEFGWTPGEHSQAEDRTHRLGQTRGVTCYYLTALGTIEESLCKLLHRKQKILSTTLDGKGSGKDVDLMNELLEILRK